MDVYVINSCRINLRKVNPRKNRGKNIPSERKKKESMKIMNEIYEKKNDITGLE